MTNDYGKVIKRRSEILTEIKKALPDLEDGFMTMADFNAGVTAKRIAPRPTLEVMDLQFEARYPAHPLAVSRRFTRIHAADRIMELASWCRKPLPTEILDALHKSLFDCSAAVRHSIASALFLAGNESSVVHLQKLLEQEQESPAVRLRARAALERLASHDLIPDTEVPQVIVVLDNLLLVEKLMETAAGLGGVLRHARPRTRDIIDFIGFVKIIDHKLLGWKAWKEFCQHLASVPDDTPLIIVDDEPPGNPPGFRRPLTTGRQFYTPVWMCEEVSRLAGEFLKQTVPEAAQQGDKDGKGIKQ